jgi:acetyl esterase/lipase
MANEQEEMLALLRAPLIYRAPGTETVSVLRSGAYRAAAEGEPRMDVYAPAGLSEEERRPVVLFIHGGPIPQQLPLLPTDWGVYRGYGSLAAASGWIGVTFNHRYWGFDRLQQAAEDVSAAVAYVREHADELHADAGRLCLWAFSGGGPFLADALREPPDGLRCLVAYYAVLDLRPLASAEGTAGHVAAETLRRFSPVAAVEERGAMTIPLLLARAGHDSPALNVLLDAFVGASLAANLSLDLLNHPAGEHSFDVRNDDARTREIIGATLTFVRTHLER